MIDDIIKILQEYQKQVTPSRIKFVADISALLKACKVDTSTLDEVLDAVTSFNPQTALNTLNWIDRHPLIKRVIERHI